MKEFFIFILVANCLMLEGVNVPFSKSSPHLDLDRGRETTLLRLYEDNDFTGYRKNVRLAKGQCLDLPDYWNDVTSSIDIPDVLCVLIWKDYGCRGFVVRMEKNGFGTDRLSRIQMDDEISSLSIC